eukprot:5782246-Prymnesium_polylepis.1
MTWSTLCCTQANTSRSKASVMARAANGSKVPPSTRKSPDETDQPAVGTPSARGASETGACFQARTTFGWQHCQHRRVAGHRRHPLHCR